jgi:hypothetical protein
MEPNISSIHKYFQIVDNMTGTSRIQLIRYETYL